MQGTFLLLHLLTRVAFKLDASNSFIVASCVIGLGLEVEAFSEMMGNSSLGSRVRVGQMCRDRELGISVILLMVDLRVVDIFVVDHILDMDEFNSHQVVSNWDLSRVIIPDTVLELGDVTYARGWMRMCVEFRDEILLRRGECKTREKFQFSQKGQNRNFGKNPKFFYISDDETDFSVEIVSRNLATTSNFVGFRGGRDFMFFEAWGVG